MGQSKIERGSYVRVVKGDLLGKVYKVFDISREGSFIAVGVTLTTESVNIDNVILTSKDDFDETNQTELSQEVSFS